MAKKKKTSKLKKKPSTGGTKGASTPKKPSHSDNGPKKTRVRKKSPGTSNKPSSKEIAEAALSQAGKKKGVFPIVGIGASAGGLAALKTFFANVPEDSGLAYVVIVHLSPEHKSHLPELLQPHVKMPVQQVAETVKLERNRVYIIPPNANLDTIDTHLRLTDLERDRQQRAPIDHFFRTLAKTHDGEAVGVILTGTGSDGTLGIREIKEAGGLALVQDPNEAEFDGMPQSAIATGMIDLVLPIERIPEAIYHSLNTRPRLPAVEADEPIKGDGQILLQKVFAQLRARTGRDFSRYKPGTIVRRIERRMQIRRIEEVNEYLDLLRREPEEVRTLSDDMLITVTSFFRDPQVFEMLEARVIPEIVHAKTAGEEIRIWTVGCATGEEAYSLAMVLHEELARAEVNCRVQIFASDLHEHSLQRAREGFYPGDIQADLSPKRLERYFAKENGGYRICKEIREMVVFTPHNLMGDPPFSRLDLVSCRNVLIYLQREVQRDIIELFHYALKPDGFLVVGTSETIDSSELFRTVEKKHCIYRKRNVPGPEPRLPVFPLTRARLAGERPRSEPMHEPLDDELLHQRMLERYGPASVLISPEDKVLHLSEHAGRYFLNPRGKPTDNVFKLIRPELQIELRTVLHAARNKGETIDSKPISVRFNGTSGLVVLRVRPALESRYAGFALLIFEEHEPLPKEKPPGEKVGGSQKFHELELEHDQLRQRLQAIIEEYETSQEEMKASNEEMQSTNEELRSTMEELETSKEELQSMNEELQTVNQENRHKVEELSQLSSDLQNLLAATDIATLFLNRKLRILRFTPKIGELFNVRMTDRGRPLADLTHRLGNVDLSADARQVLEQLVPVEREIQAESGQWYLTRLRPYRSDEDRIEGVVITLVDITANKRTEQDLQDAKEYAESIVETLHEPLLVLNPDLIVRSCNPAFYEHFQVRREDTEGRRIYDLGNGQWDIPALRDLLENVLPSNNIFNDYEVRHEFDDLGERIMLLNGRRLDHVQLILLGIRDITDRKRAEAALQQSEEQLQEILQQLPVGVGVLDGDGQWILRNSILLDLIPGPLPSRDSKAMARWQSWTDHGEAIEPANWPGARALRGETVIPPLSFLHTQEEGTQCWIQVGAAPFRSSEGELAGAIVVTEDVTDRTRAEQELRRVKEELEQRIIERTAELHQQNHKLRKLAKQLSEAEQQERGHLAKMLHDGLQQILVACRMHLDPEAEDWETEGVRRLDELLQQAIEVSRSLSYELSPPALHSLDLPGALNWLARHFQTHHRLAVEIEANEKFPALGDDLKIFLFTAVRELLLNVVKYAGVHEAKVILEEADASSNRACLAVTDQGAGFDPGRLESGEVDAHGFGLFSIRERIVALGGTFEIDAAPDQGTKIRLCVPAARDEEPQATMPASARKKSRAKPHKSRADTPTRVLIVDDHALLREGLRSLFDRQDEFEIIGEACNGLQAVEQVDKLRPDVVLMDVNMPRMNGIEATRTIHERHPEIPIIALSFQEEAELGEPMREAGAVGYLQKDSDAARVFEEIRRVCQKR